MPGLGTPELRIKSRFPKQLFMKKTGQFSDSQSCCQNDGNLLRECMPRGIHPTKAGN
jgi:hypothetical protein